MLRNIFFSFHQQNHQVVTEKVKYWTNVKFKIVSYFYYFTEKGGMDAPPIYMRVEGIGQIQMVINLTA